MIKLFSMFSGYGGSEFAGNGWDINLVSLIFTNLFWGKSL